MSKPRILLHGLLTKNILNYNFPIFTILLIFFIFIVNSNAEALTNNIITPNSWSSPQGQYPNSYNATTGITTFGNFPNSNNTIIMQSLSGIINCYPNQISSYVIKYNYTDYKAYAYNDCNNLPVQPSLNHNIVFSSAIQNVINSGHGGIQVGGDEFDFKQKLVIPPTFQGFYFKTQPSTIFDLENHGVGMEIDSANRCDIELGILQGDFGDNTTGLHIYPHGFNAKGQSDFALCHVSWYSIRDFNTLVHIDGTAQNVYQLIIDNYADMDNSFSVPMTKNATGILLDGKEISSTANIVQNIRMNLNYIYAGHPSLFNSGVWWTGIKIGNSTYNGFADVDGIHIITEGLGGNGFSRAILLDTWGSQGTFDVQFGNAQYGIILEPNTQDNVLKTTSFYNLVNPIKVKTLYHNNGMYNVTGFFKIS